jgi:hypothetical protein
MTKFLVVPALAILFTLSGCGTAPQVEPAELRNEDAKFNREDCVYPAIWHDNSQVCWEGSRKPEGR